MNNLGGLGGRARPAFGPVSSDTKLSQALFIDSWPELMARASNLRVHVVTKPLRVMHVAEILAPAEN